MSARLADLQRLVGVTRRRLEDLTRRLAAVREHAAPGHQSSPGSAPAAPLFQGIGLGDGALDDVDLQFEVLDTEDPGREGR